MESLYQAPEQKSSVAPAYYAVIPGDVLCDDDISAGAKLLYGCITALTRHSGDCWATDDYLASVFKLHPKTISSQLRALEKAGYISIIQEARPQPGQCSRRHIRMNVSFTGAQTQSEKIPTQSEKIPDQNFFTPPTSNINKKDNIKGGESLDDESDDMRLRLLYMIGEWEEAYDKAPLYSAEGILTGYLVGDELRALVTKDDSVTVTGLTRLLNTLNRLALGWPEFQREYVIADHARRQMMDVAGPWFTAHRTLWTLDTCDEVWKALQEFAQYRRETKHTMTPVAMRKLLSKLDDIAQANPQIMIDCLNTAIENGWRTVYPPKEGNGNQGAPASGIRMPDGMIEL